MPMYEYRCGSCSERFEELARSSEVEPPPCPHCGSREVTRLFSTFGTRWRSKLVNWHRV
jgi:putative FmdB family regulatory protein